MFLVCAGTPRDRVLGPGSVTAGRLEEICWKSTLLGPGIVEIPNRCPQQSPGGEFSLIIAAGLMPLRVGGQLHCGHSPSSSLPCHPHRGQRSRH